MSGALRPDDVADEQPHSRSTDVLEDLAAIKDQIRPFTGLALGVAFALGLAWYIVKRLAKGLQVAVLRRRLSADLSREEARRRAKRASRPYVFTPTTLEAYTLDEFCSLCREIPGVASHHFRQGYFEPWLLQNLGRGDLSNLARITRLRGGSLAGFVQAVVPPDTSSPPDSNPPRFRWGAISSQLEKGARAWAGPVAIVIGLVLIYALRDQGTRQFFPPAMQTLAAIVARETPNADQPITQSRAEPEQPLEPVRPTPAPVRPGAAAKTVVQEACSGPDEAVRRALEAIQRGDSGGYLLSIDPALRSMPNSLQQQRATFQNLEVKTLECQGNWAEVQVQGTMRTANPTTERQLNNIEIAHYVNGQWLLSHLFLRASDPEWAAGQQQTARAVATGTAVAQVRATAIAQTSEAERAIAEQDWFVAATLLRSLLLDQPDHFEAQRLLNSIAEHVPGGLLMAGQASNPPPPGYFSFIDTVQQPIPNLPEWTHRQLGMINPEGTRAIFWQYGCGSKINFLDLHTGAVTETAVQPNTTCENTWSPDGRRYYINESRSKTFKIYDIDSKNVIESCQLNNVGSPSIYWMPDGIRVAHIDGMVPVITIVNANNGECLKVEIPGLNGSMRVMMSPNNQGFWIAAPEQFMAVDFDGKNIRRLFALPKQGWSRVLAPKDMSAVYLDGLVVSTKTGRSARFLMKGERGIQTVAAVAWRDRPLVASRDSTVQLTITPDRGSRGTRFRFGLMGAPPNQEIRWVVKEPTGTSIYGRAKLDENGTLMDSGQADGFGFSTGLASKSGRYQLEVYQGDRLVTTSAFDVAD